MFYFKAKMLCFLLTALFFTVNAVAGTPVKKQGSTYKVDFNNPEIQQKKEKNNEKKTDKTKDTELKIFLLNKDHALSLEPRAMESMKLQYGNKKNSSPTTRTEHEEQKAQ